MNTAMNKFTQKWRGMCGKHRAALIVLLLMIPMGILLSIAVSATGVPAYEDLVAETGKFVAMEDISQPDDPPSWRIELAYGMGAYYADDIIHFDAEDFASRVQPGDVLTFLVEPGDGGRVMPYEIRRGDEVIHAYATSIAGRAENRQTGIFFGILLATGGAVGLVCLWRTKEDETWANRRRALL